MNQQSYINYLKNLSQSEMGDEIQDKISNTCQQILNTEEASSAIAETNAPFGWYVEDSELEDDDINFGEDKCTVKVNYKASGDQDEESGFWGNQITGTAEAVMDEFGEVTYWNITAEVTDINSGEDYDDIDEDYTTEDEDNEYTNNITEDEDNVFF